MAVTATHRPPRRWWAVTLASLVLLLAVVALVSVSRGVYDVAPFPDASPPAWTAPCARAPEYEHEPQCARVRGRVLWRELDDPDGDGDRHLVLVSRLRLRVVKLMPDRDYGGPVPGFGDVVEAVGFTAIGASGEREIYTEALRR